MLGTDRQSSRDAGVTNGVPCDGLEEWRARLRCTAAAAEGRRETWRRSWPVERASRRDMVVDVEDRRSAQTRSPPPFTHPDALRGRLCCIRSLSRFQPPPLKMSSGTNGTAQPAMIFDSLPYYDNELEQYPILKEKVERELAREGKPPQALHPSVPPEPTLFAVRAHRSVSLVVLDRRIDRRARITPCCKPSLTGYQITACCPH